jgi:hypothetical protein
VSITSTVFASPIQNGAYDALAANVAFYTTALAGRLYTDVPQSTPFPIVWLTFEDPMETPQSAFGRVGRVTHLALHVYSDYGGDDQALDLMQQAIEILDAGFAVPGWSVVWVHAELPQTITVEEYNGRALRHGIARVDVHAFKES